MKKGINIVTLIVCLMANVQLLCAQNDALKILPNGNVGIGATNPKEKLQVDGNIKSNGRIEDKTGSIMPVGSILAFAGSKIPEGWLLCDGSSYLTSGDKSELFSVIGTLYGGQNGQFKVPDLRQTFVMGANATIAAEQLGKNGNADRHSHLISPPQTLFTTTTDGYHHHDLPAVWYKRNFSSGGYSGVDTGGNVKDQSTQYNGEHFHKVTINIPTFSSDAYTGENRPKWGAMNYIIKY
jgi:hypothetical protein